MVGLNLPSFYLYGRPKAPLHERFVIGNLAIQGWDNSVRPPPLLTDPVAVSQRWDDVESFHHEPDGSFVWTGDLGMERTANNPRWELCGTFFERDDQHLHAEIQGFCDPFSWTRFLELLSGKPATPQPFSVQLLLSPRMLIPAEDLPKIWQAVIGLRYAYR